MSDSIMINVRIIRPAARPVYTDPIDAELQSFYGGRFEAHVTDREPTAAGMDEIAYIAAISGAIGLACKFFEPLVTDLGQRFRDCILQFANGSPKNNDTPRRYIPFRIEFGTKEVDGHLSTPVAYTFHRLNDANDFLEQLQGADAHIRTLPPEYFERPQGPTEYTYWWDGETRTWRGQVFDPNEGPNNPADWWMPDDMH